MKTFLNILLIGALALAADAKEIKLLNVSYDPTRELYQDYNTAFARYWKA
jgi:sulfate transport system substrate-binding protein